MTAAPRADSPGVLLWAVISPAGRIVKVSARPRLREAIAAVAPTDAAWRGLVSNGWRTRRVVVAEVEAWQCQPTTRVPVTATIASNSDPDISVGAA